MKTLQNNNLLIKELGLLVFFITLTLNFAWGEEIPTSVFLPEETKETTLPSFSLNQTFPSVTPQKISDEIWETLSPMPTPRSEVVTVNLGDKIYVIGGFDKNDQPTDVIEVYDPANNSWEVSSSIPKILHHAGAASFEEKLFIVGGYSDYWTPSRSFFIYDPIDDSWITGPDMPTPRGALTVQFVAGRLYAIGGANPIPLSVNEEYDPTNNVWSTKSPMPTAREHLASAVIDDKMYVIGGRIIFLTSNLNSNEVYDPRTDTWEKLEEMPTPRGGLTASQINGTIFVFGGETARSTFDNNEQFIPGEGWHTRLSMPTARHGLGSATVHDTIYVIGGGTSPGISVSGINEAYYNSQFIPEFGSFTLVVLLISIVIVSFILPKNNFNKSSRNCS